MLADFILVVVRFRSSCCNVDGMVVDCRTVFGWFAGQHLRAVVHVAAGTSVRHASCGWFSRTVAAAWWRVRGRAGQSAKSGVVECRIGESVQAPF